MEQMQHYEAPTFTDCNVRLTKLSDLFHKPNKDRVSVIGVIVGFSTPKRCGPRATHQYSFSIFVIDPSFGSPSQYITINWFSNHLDDFHCNWMSGDVVLGGNLTVDRYRERPQLVGNDYKSPMLMFHRRTNHLSGCPEANTTSSSSSNQPAVNVANTSSFESLLRNYPGFFNQQWEISMLGMLDNSRKPSQLIRTYQLSAPVHELHKWGEREFRVNSMVDDDYPYAALHKLQLELNGHLSETINPYLTLEPPADPSSANVGLIDAESCDTIALVLGQLPPEPFDYPDARNAEEGNDSLFKIPRPGIGLLIWDGTTNGCFELPADELGAQISKSLGTAETYSHCNDLESFIKTQEDLLAAPVTHGSSKLLGSAVEIRSVDEKMDKYISRFQPGMWIRIRSLRVPKITTNVFPKPMNRMSALIWYDTYLSLIQPYFRDVTSLTKRYFTRVSRLFFMKNQQQQQQQQRARRTCSLDGHPYTNLALAVSSPFPAKFCCFGKILSWWPQNIEQFVSNQNDDNTSSNTESADEDVFMFSLTVTDGSLNTDIIFYDKEAEYFFGDITAPEFKNNTELRLKIENTLNRLVEEKKEMEFFVKLYTSIQYKTSEESPKKRRKLKIDSDSPRISRVEKRRMSVFNTRMPFFTDLQNDKIID